MEKGKEINQNKDNKKIEKKENITNKEHKTKRNTKQEQREENIERLKQHKNKTFYTAFGHAIDGIIRAFKTERNLRIDYVIGLTVFICSLFFDFTKTEFACICLTIGFVIFAEMINSAVEYIVDLVTDKYDDRAKAAKDIAAGCVLIASCVSVVVAYFLFEDKLYNATTHIIKSMLSSRLHILFTIIFAITLLTVILKGFFCKDDEYSKSHPSLRVALAFGLTAYSYLITKSLFVGGVTFLLSIMISQMKVQNSKTRPIYVLISALLGILVVLVIYQIVLFAPSIEQILTNLL